jgi:hypothetical protein
VGAVHSAFYEVFDHLGPQLRWWAWNTENDLNQPFFASVPMTSVTLFSVVAPAGLVWMLRRFVTGRSLRLLPALGRGVLIGALVPLWMTAAAIPYTLAGENLTARGTVLAGELVLVWLLVTPVLLDAWRHGGAAPSLPVRLFGPAFLAVMAVLWATGPDAGPQGNVPFGVLCFAAATLALVAARRRKEPANGPQGLGRVTAPR